MQRRILAGKSAGKHVAVHFIGRDVNKPLDAQLSGELQQDECARHIRVNSGRGLINAAVHVRFGGKMDHGVGAAHRFFGRIRIANTSFYEGIIRVGRNRFQICQVAGVCQFVVIDDLVTLAEGKDMPDEIRADKSGAAGDKELHRNASFVAISCASRSCGRRDAAARHSFLGDNSAAGTRNQGVHQAKINVLIFLPGISFDEFPRVPNQLLP